MVPFAFRGEVELGEKLLELCTELGVLLDRFHRARVEDHAAVAPRVASVKVPLAEDASLAVADGTTVGGLVVPRVPVPLILCPLHVQPPSRDDLGVTQDGLGPQVPLPASLQVVPLHGNAVHPRGDLAVTSDAGNRHFATKTFLAKFTPRESRREVSQAENVGGAMMTIVYLRQWQWRRLGPVTSPALSVGGLPAAGVYDRALACLSARLLGLANVLRRPWIFAEPKSLRNRPKSGVEWGYFVPLCA